MMHSQLPVQSLLCVLLMLPRGRPRGLSHMPLTDEGVQTALAFAVQQYNKDQGDSVNYFKQVSLQKAQLQVMEVVPPLEYHLTVVLVKTACKKKTGVTKPYKKIQKCKELPGNPQISCYFKVISYRELNNMNLKVTTCT